jgi:hypothetical protein
VGEPTTIQRPTAAGGAQRRRLGRYANSASPRSLTPEAADRQKRKHSKRRQRYSLRYKLRNLTTLKRVRDCGHVSINGEGSGPALRLTAADKGGTVAGLSGLAHCGSVWACPVCAAKIATRRAEELADVMRYALEQGCSASMVTLTMRHHQGQSLADCWAALSKGWRAVTTGKQWTTDADGAGLVGWVRAVEVTQGKNGWHVHVHALLVWREAIDQEDADVIGQRMWQRWTRALRRCGFDSLMDSGGLDVRMATLKPGAASGLHEYFTKLAHEVTGGQAKLAKGAGRTPFQLLTEAVNGLADEVDLWHEWERASKGRRQMEWSRGRRDLREWAGLGAEQTDEEIAEEELTGDDLVLLAPESWRELREQPDQVCELLEATERAGFAAATALLDIWGLRWLPGKAALSWPKRPPGSARLDVERAEVGDQLRGRRCGRPG